MKAAIAFLLLSASLAASAPESRAVRQCATCHPAQAKFHPQASMAHAMELVTECAILKEHPLLTFKEGPYSYRIERKGDQSIYSVTDGQQTITAPVAWAFGLGLAGQTYVFLLDGEYYESRVSYYRALNGLDLTIGAGNRKPSAIVQAAGEIMLREERTRCFGCHATNATQGAQLTVERMTAGVQCERCHGPADNHMQGLKQGDGKLAHMNDLRKLSTEDLSNFCGQCHRTWDEIAAGGKLGIANVRFQPYRLTNSKCYDSDDPRISCVACHDPHKEIDRTIADYDSRCQTCHAGGKPKARVCKVAKSNCVSCHMPKIEMPGSHYKFTDHRIRIARTNEAYPE